MQSAIKAAATVTVTKEEAWSEIVREIGVRERCFDSWVEQGKLAWADARDRYARLKKAEEYLKAIVNDEHVA